MMPASRRLAILVIAVGLASVALGGVFVVEAAMSGAGQLVYAAVVSLGAGGATTLAGFLRLPPR